jgi:acetyltransferase-like isoleucine patch superfamily enzyme/acyl carrier protein
MSRLDAALQPVRHRSRASSDGFRRRLSSALGSIYLRSCSRVGKGAEVRGRPFIENFGRIEIGDDFRLNSVPVQSHLVTGYRGRLEIGHGVAINFGAAIAAHAAVTVGNRVHVGPFAMIMDTDFHDVVARDELPEGGAIVIGDNVRVGSRVTILKDSVIGTGATILAGSVVSGSIPPGARAGGVPARVLDPAGDRRRTLFVPVDGYSAALSEDAVPERVRRVVATTFLLEELPDPTSGPDSIPAWDSLGSLTLLLDLEDEFQVSLAQEDMLEVRSVQDMASMILRARDREPLVEEDRWIPA